LLNTSDETDKEHSGNVQSDTKKKLHWLEVGYFSSQIVLAIIGILALCIYHGQLTAMKGQLDEMGKQSKQLQKQTTLIQDETIGSKGAVLQFAPLLTVLANKEDGPALISTVKAAGGRITANNIVLKVTAQRIVLPSMKPIGSPIQCDIAAPQLASFDHENGIVKVCELPGFSTTAADEVMYTRQSVTISGHLTYENGFGRVITQPICQTFMGYRYKGETKSPNGSTNLISGEDDSFHDCDDFDRILRRAMRFKSRYQENYIPERP
jgi:hypothetical protein